MPVAVSFHLEMFLAGIELIFLVIFLLACTVRIMLITHKCLNYCQAVLSLNRGLLIFPYSTNYASASEAQTRR